MDVVTSRIRFCNSAPAWGTTRDSRLDNDKKVEKDDDDFPDADVLWVATIATRMHRWLVRTSCGWQEKFSGSMVDGNDIFSDHGIATPTVKDGREETVGCSES